VEDLKAAGNLDVGTSKAISVHSIVAKPSWEGTRNACFGALDHWRRSGNAQSRPHRSGRRKFRKRV